MENVNEIPEEEYKPFDLVEKIYDMMRYGHPILRNFPRRERHLADTIDQKMDELLEYAIIIQKKYYKQTTLREIDTTLAVLRRFVRLAQDEQYFNHSGNQKKVAPPLTKEQYEVWSRYMREVGNLIGGCMKSPNMK